MEKKKTELEVIEDMLKRPEKLEKMGSDFLKILTARKDVILQKQKELSEHE